MIKIGFALNSKLSNVTACKVIAAIPCFNTQGSIAGVVTRARRYVDEVIVIDDGSADRTAEIAQFAGARVVSHGVNKGYGEAVKSCFSAARAENADILIIIDGDGQHNPDEIPSLVTPILTQAADLVIGSRFLAKGKSIPFYRSLGIKFINSIWNLGSRIKVSDTQSGFRGYNRWVIKNLDISEKGMAASIEILEQIRNTMPVIKEIPISCSYENINSSLSLKALVHGMSVAFSVLRIRLKNRFRIFSRGRNIWEQKSNIDA